MCGRYPQSKKARDHARLLAAREAMQPPRPETWNLAPTTQSLVVKRDCIKDDLAMDWLIWGFQNREQAPSCFNARLETASEKQLFKNAWVEDRCVIPADGWFEWRGERGRKQPYFFHLVDGRPLFLAGLWQRRTFVLLTMDAGTLTPYQASQPWRGRG